MKNKREMNFEIKQQNTPERGNGSIENHFNDINKVLLSEFKNVKETLIVAVAYFTDQEILDVLSNKAKSGVFVKLLLSNDRINLKLDFKQLSQFERGYVWYIPKEKMSLMHHKFAVIDLNTTIIGSYNYTNNAKNSEENISIIRNNVSTATQYKDRFLELRNTYCPNDPLSIRYKNRGKVIDAIYYEALEKMKNNDLEGALEFFTEITHLDDRFYPALQNRGALKAMTGDLNGALEDLNRVLRIQPENTDALKSLGGIYFHLKDFNSAMVMLTKAINFEPNNSDLHYERGRMKMLLQDYLGAISDLKNTIDLNPNDAEAIMDYNECINILTKS